MAAPFCWRVRQFLRNGCFTKILKNVTSGLKRLRENSFRDGGQSAEGFKPGRPRAAVPTLRFGMIVLLAALLGSGIYCLAHRTWAAEYLIDPVLPKRYFARR